MALRTINDETLSAIAEAIRDKNGKTTTYLPTEMPDAIANISGGGGDGPTEAERTFTDNIDYMFANGNFIDWQDRFPFILKDIRSMSYTFSSCPEDADLSGITITTIDLDDNQAGANAAYAFQKSNINSLPMVNGSLCILNSRLFYFCYYLQDDKIRDFIMNPNLKLAWRPFANNSSSIGVNQLFGDCYSLKNVSDILLYIHQWFIDNPITYTRNLTDSYSTMCHNCYSLDEVCNIPVIEFPSHGGNTSNMMSSIVTYCGRAKDVTFCTNNGVPYVKKWKGQTFDLSTYTGYTSLGGRSNILNYNSGITADKQVTDDTTYQALKDDPDWFTTNVAYSRYNHDSAVNTINSLPDCSAYLATAGGTNTIKFKGAAGELTDGGAINTLTEEEIAVAVAKGWTVTLV